MFEFTEKYITGIDFIDREHRELFRIGKEAYSLLKNEWVLDKYDSIVKIIKELREYAKVHFSNEEAYMESIHYKRMFTQKMDHQAFIDKVYSLDFELVDHNQEVALNEIFNFLNGWLTNHILEQDMLIIDYL